MKALILAAGLGTRLLPHTQHLPKPLFELGGRPMLERVMDRLTAAGCTGIMINTHHRHRQIEAFVATRRQGPPVTLSHEPVITGTGGAMRNALSYFGDACLVVVNSDLLFDIDLEEVYAFHRRSGQPATLVLHDYPKFNKVSVDPEHGILDFDGTAAGNPDSVRPMAFTGIQVVSPQIQEFLPDSARFSSIDAYRNILSAGVRLSPFDASGCYWRDIGTPESFRDGAFELVAEEVFRGAFPDEDPGEIRRIRLAGDGSDRGWYRAHSGANSLVVADHGITTLGGTCETDAFIEIGRHLCAKGLPVPAIHHADRFSGLVFLEDLGDRHFASAVLEAKKPKDKLSLYRKAIDLLFEMSQRGLAGFDSAWTFQTAEFDAKVILEMECRYFVDSFLVKRLGISADFTEFEDEFLHLANNALKYPLTGFIHRDFQSRNIMVKGERLFLIDFQSGRLGPLQYDLASLLIDPYTGLDEPLCQSLIAYAANRAKRDFAMDVQQFCHSYRYCALSRNLQMLGAFAKLAGEKGKKQFEAYIPAALKTLKRQIGRFDRDEFQKLATFLEEIEVSE